VADGRAPGLPARLHRRRPGRRRPGLPAEAGRMSTQQTPAAGEARALAARPHRIPAVLASLSSGNVRAVLERGFTVIRNQNWMILVSGFFEPVFYLLAMGVGMGMLVGEVEGPGGAPITYAAYIAPALLATSAM